MTIQDENSTSNVTSNKNNSPQSDPKARDETVTSTVTNSPKESTVKKTFKTLFATKNKQNTRTLPNQNNPVIKTQSISKLAVVAIVIAIVVGGGVYGVYYNAHQLIAKQNQQMTVLSGTIQNLQSQLTQQAQENQQNRLITDKINKAQQFAESIYQKQFSTLASKQDVLEHSVSSLNEKMAAMSSVDTQSWLISQANYFVTLAARKIWSEQDFASALLLLKSADSSLAELNDPSLLSVREALAHDMQQIAPIGHVDFDNVMIQLNTLADNLLSLPLAKDETHTHATTANTPDSHTLSNWKQNLATSLQHFSKSFITIKKREPFQTCLANAKSDGDTKKCAIFSAILAPEQTLYLKENLRLQLFLASQAVEKHQNAIYHQSLDNVETWVRAYFDLNEPLTKSFLSTLSELQKYSLNVKLPDNLASAKLLDYLMHTRVKSLLNGVNVNTGEEK